MFLWTLKCRELLTDSGGSLIQILIQKTSAIPSEAAYEPFCGSSLKKHQHTKQNTACAFWAMRIIWRTGYCLVGLCTELPWEIMQACQAWSFSVWARSAGIFLLGYFWRLGSFLQFYSFLFSLHITAGFFYTWCFSPHYYSDTEVNNTLSTYKCERLIYLPAFGLYALSLIKCF